jgi:hypothetical protein
MQQRVVLFNYFVGAGEQRGAEGRERRDQLFSSRLSSLKKRQSVPCELILLGVNLIMPDSCFLGGARPAEVEISARHDPHMRKIQNLAEERAIGFGFLGANDDVCARYRDFLSVSVFYFSFTAVCQIAHQLVLSSELANREFD